MHEMTRALIRAATVPKVLQEKAQIAFVLPAETNPRAALHASLGGKHHQVLFKLVPISLPPQEKLPEQLELS